MARTQLKSLQIGDEAVERSDLNTTTPGSAVIRKIIAGTNVELISTGADSGTGDVTINVNLSGESNPVFTYTDGLITRIDYASTNYKVLTYASGLLTQLDYVIGSTTKRKTFNYDANDNLLSIIETTL